MIPVTKILSAGAATSGDPRAGSPAPRATALASARAPVVVWNMTSLCNLECRHCYLDGSPGADSGSLTTGEARDFVDDLAALGAPALLFSGGEPLLRDDLFDLVARAAAGGVRASVSTNGTLVTKAAAERLAAAGASYIGVSLDGVRAAHDALRGRRGAFAAALKGLANAAAAGLRTGVRFTLSRRNVRDLPAVLDVVEAEGIGRFCMYHLVYAGRGAAMRREDVTQEESRAAVETLAGKALDWAARGVRVEILTADNHADGVMLMRYVERTEPARAAEARSLLEPAGGCSAGRKFACVDSAGDARPCQFWRHESFANVRATRFSHAWNSDASDILRALRDMPSRLTGRRCGACRYKTLCGGCRIRALAATGDIWGDDPKCYLSDSEIGL